MLKILIADGDADSVHSFMNHLEGAKAEVKEIKVLSQNPSRIKALAEDYKPNVILADAGFLGGLCAEVVGELYLSHPEIKWILYASYSENGLIQKCMEFELFDYLYKPVKGSELLRCVQNAAKYFDGLSRKSEEERQEIENYRQELDRYREWFIWDLLNDRVGGSDEIARGLKYYSLDLGKPYTVFVIRPESGEAGEQEKNLEVHYTYRAVMKELEGRGFTALKERAEVCVIMCGVDAAEQIRLCEKIRDLIFEQHRLTVSVGLGRAYDDAAKIAVSYREACWALRYGFYMGKGSVISMGFAEPLGSAADCFSPETEQELCRLAAMGDYDGCMERLKKIKAALDDCGSFPAEAVKWLGKAIAASIIRRGVERGLSPEKYFPVQNLRGTADLVAYFASALGPFCQQSVARRDEDDKRLVELARNYLKGRYRESFNLKELAASAGTTPEYLEKIFEDCEGIGIQEQLTRLRIEEAKRLLKITAYADDVIAIKSGFDDAKHLKAVFKEHEGISIREFKSKK